MKAANEPNFVYIGAPKCGSTWIFRALAAHPEVFVPAAKDIYYFDKYYGRGRTWYESFFGPADPRRHKAIGELSHDYLFSAEAPARIAADLPAAKLLACLRNPIDRAWSAYNFKRRNHHTSSTFRATMEEHPMVLERGRYFEHLRRYESLLDSGRLKIFWFDDLERDPGSFATGLYQYVGVDPRFVYLDAGRKVLPASLPRWGAMAYTAKRGAVALRRAGLADLIGRVKRSDCVQRLLYQPIRQKETMAECDRVWLAEYYRQDLEALERLLGVRLGHWLEEIPERCADAKG